MTQHPFGCLLESKYESNGLHVAPLFIERTVNNRSTIERTDISSRQITPPSQAPIAAPNRINFTRGRIWWRTYSTFVLLPCIIFIVDVLEPAELKKKTHRGVLGTLFVKPHTNNRPVCSGACVFTIFPTHDLGEMTHRVYSGKSSLTNEVSEWTIQGLMGCPLVSSSTVCACFEVYSNIQRAIFQLATHHNKKERNTSGRALEVGKKCWNTD